MPGLDNFPVKKQSNETKAEPKTITKTKIVEVEKPLPNEVIHNISKMYEAYKSRFNYSENPSKNRRNPKNQRTISIINEYFKFESKESEVL